MKTLQNNNEIFSNFKEDTKFASKYEIDLLNKLTKLNLNYDDLILLEKLAGDDYRKKVYLNDNCQIGTLEFDLLDLHWKFVPSPYYYTIEQPKIKLKPTKRRLKGKYLKEEYIENFNEYNNIVENTDYFVGIDMGNFLGVGIKRDNRIKVKDLQRKKEISIEKIEKYLKNNENRINKLVEHSKNILIEYIQKYENKNYVINVSFSGGKDSAVSTLLAKEILEDIDVLFIDTGLEYPETNQYVKDFAKKYDLNLKVIDGDNFWNEIDEEGIPTKDDRWCNSSCKLIPLENFFDEEYGEDKKILTIDGSRKLESFARANLGYIRQSGFIENQTNLFPLLDWNSIDIWSYIFLNNVLYNPMYEEGFERIGCYMCPAALNSEFLRVKELHPDLWEKWANYLRKDGYSEEEILRGFWRWDQLPPKMNELRRNLENR